MRIRMTAALAVTALILVGCDSGGSAVETRERAGAGAGAETALALTSAVEPEGATVEAAPVAKTPVTANRRETVNAKIQRLYERNGSAFGAKSAEDYLAKVQAFTANPPRGTEKVKRPNGDTLYYQASSNTFAVTDRNGVPRTMFKPDDGVTYWTQQKERAPTFGQRRPRSGD